MKVYIANIINSLTLIVLGSIAYFLSDTPSLTAFIPVVAGIIMISFTQKLKNHNKTIAHIIVTLTLIIIIALFKPLLGAISREDTGSIIRVFVMISSGILAMSVFIKSFIDARLNKKVNS